jgi:toxin YhaV
MVIHGWNIFWHPCFEQQLLAYLEKVLADAERHPDTFRSRRSFKLLEAIVRLAFSAIPADPGNSIYRQGDTLGEGSAHWFRAKFYQQYRLYFRYDLASRVIIYAWVNDDRTRRAYGSKTDAYAVFAKMLAAGHPPGDWADLKQRSSDGSRIQALT